MSSVEVERPVPGPVGLPLVGSMFSGARDPLDFMTRLQREWGDVASFRVGRDHFVLLSHPDDVERLLVAEKDGLVKDRVTHKLSDVLGQGLLTSEGDTWRRQRKLAAPSFQPKQVAAYGEVMVRTTLDHLPPVGRACVHERMGALTLDVVVRTLFGAEPSNEAERVGPLTAELMSTFETENRTVWRIVPSWVPGRHRRRVKALTRELDGLLGDLIRARRTRPAGDDLLWRLLAARDDEGTGMSDRQLRDEALTIFLAGHETTAIALSFALWLLAAHPEELRRAHAEVDALGAEPTTADLGRLPYVGAVVKEAMRLYPPAWAMGREAVAPLVIRGHAIEPGRQVAVSPWVLHHDPRWWIEPERFRPDRWSTGETTSLPRFAFLPFGGGPRVCIGNHFATMEAVLVLATILRHRSVARTGDPDPRLLAAVTLRPRDGMPLRFLPRSAVPEA